MNISEVINEETTGNRAVFDYCRGGCLYYRILDKTSGKSLWLFPVDTADVKADKTFGSECRVDYLAAFIQIAIDRDALLRL